MQSTIERPATTPPAMPDIDVASGDDPVIVTPAWRTGLRNALLYTVGSGGMLLLLSTMLPFDRHLTLPLLFVAGAFLLGAIRLEAYGSWFSVGLLPVIAAAYLYGPLGGSLAGFATALGGEFRMKRANRRSFFNAGLFALAGYAGAATGSTLVRTSSVDALPLLLFGLSCALVISTVNVGIVCTALALEFGASPVAIWRERFRWMVPQTLLLGPVGTGLAVAYRTAGVYEVVAFALPVVAMQIAWKQYLAHTARSVEDLREKNANLIKLAARLQTANEAVVQTYRGTLEALVGALDARDNEVQGHSYRVSAYSQVMAERMGIERGSPTWETIARGALLHDVGKIGVHDAVLLKPGKLDKDEWVLMEAHSQIGFNMLAGVEFLKPAAALVQAHHERYDGRGYPLGLAGEQIPLGARIFAVCDTFDAITSDRPYRRAAPPEAAVAEIVRCGGTQFDPVVVALFAEVWQELWNIRAKAAQMVA